MFIPEGNVRTFSLHVHKNIVYSLGAFFLIFFIGFILLVVKSGEIAAKLQLVYILTSENKRLRTEKEKIAYIAEKQDKIEQMGRYLQSIAHSARIDQKISTNSPSVPSEERRGSLSRDNADERVDNLVKMSATRGVDAAGRNTGRDLYLTALPNIQPVVDGWITRGYLVETNDTGQAHNGVDYAASQGSLIRATAPGVVESVFNDKYFGLMLTIKHAYGMSTKYGHCFQILVSKGDHVERGQTVALVGNTGRSSAPHLHYEVLKDGKNVDPTKYIVNTKTQ
jgi:murein DD-endopeptidase MepM/ murein hydrolase activator NlpD